MAHYRRRESKPFSQQLDFMMKIKPWRKSEASNFCTNKEPRAQNLHRICRCLIAYAPQHIFDTGTTAKLRRSAKWQKKREQLPFLSRNLLSGRNAWIIYKDMLQNWYAEKENRKVKSNITCKPQGDEHLDFSKATEKPDCLRSFYTVWFMNSLTSKSSRNEKELATLVSKLANSDKVAKCLLKTPSGGIQATQIDDRTKLSRKCLVTLSRWARAMTKEDGYDSGIEEDPVEIWNRTLLEANRNIKSNHEEDTKKIKR